MDFLIVFLVVVTAPKCTGRIAAEIKYAFDQKMTKLKGGA
jgi:hypothetical protein